MDENGGEIIKVSLFGAGGRMGTEVTIALNDEPGIELVNLVEKTGHPAVGSELFGQKINDEPFNSQLEGTVFCEFAGREAAVKYAALAAEMKSPILIGSTGFTEGELKYIKSLGDKIPIMAAPNLSRGIDLLYRVIELIARVSGGAFEVEIIEAHHKWKQDAPSGTAKKIEEILIDSGAYANVPAHSIRLSDIPGRHTLIFAGEGETLEITHQAFSRRAFARGAAAAIRFLAKAPPGYYSFKDALGERWL